MYKLSPSDFKYLYEDCKHCYWQKAKGIIKELPSIGMPGVFMKMNSLLQHAIMGMDLRDINSQLPAGKIQVKEGFLKSKPIPPGNDCFIGGRFDVASRLDDGTYSVIDFKITDPKEDKIQKFFAQLHAYKFALEHPAFGEPKKVSKMGVIAINPEEISFPGDTVVFTAKPQWFEIEEDMDRFYAFISEVSRLLHGPVPPENPDTCKWCYYRICTRKPQDIQDEIPF
ncbi:PD-(D/E)XK nuclease family protein [Candidatus Gottesmanbacteria bacterium]|nr:PD-(D/E)XK nuclease family protein [Candidatus Gottesmanbacteria bacterium]